MKKLIFATALFCTHAFAFGQDYDLNEDHNRKIDIGRVRFGGYAAPTISWMKPTASKSSDGLYKVTSGGGQVGFAWGLMIDYFFARNYAIATGFQLNSSGGEIRSKRVDQTTTFGNTVFDANFKYRLQYLEVPFQLKLRSERISSAGGIRAFGQVGLTGGVNINKKVTYKVDYTNSSGSMSTLTGDKEKLAGSFTIAPFLLQLNVGAGIEKPVSQRMALYCGLFFNNSFLPDVTDPGKYDLGYTGSFSDGNIRLNSFAFRFGIFF